MFPLEQIMPLIPDGHIITILDANGNSLFIASCPAMIPFRYRDKMVSSVVQGVDEVTIKLYVMEAR
jgi:hypothetical protein